MASILPRLAVAVLALAAAAPAQAQGRLDASYIAFLAGIPVGQGTWTIDIDDAQFSAKAVGTTTGLIKVFTGGQGSTSVRGTLNAGQPTLTVYAATVKTNSKTDDIRFTVDKGAAKDISIEPPQEKDSERVPVTDAMRQGILDPMTASLVRMPGTGELVTPEACQRTAAVFDGRLRYDLKLAFKRMDTVKAEKGYNGPVVVCSVSFTPIGGHIASRATIKYLTEMRETELWLAPIAGTRILAPFRVQAPTPIGAARLEATEFVTAPKVVTNKTKTQ